MDKYYIVCDIHSTIFDKKNTPILSAIRLIKCLSHRYNIIFLSSHDYVNKPGDLLSLKTALNHLDIPYTAVLLASSDAFSDIMGKDGKVKEKLLHDYFKISVAVPQIDFAIDNSKKCIKMYKKNKIHTLKINV